MQKQTEKQKEKRTGKGRKPGSTRAADDTAYSIGDNYRYAFRCLREKEGPGAFAVCAGTTALGILLPFLESAMAAAVAACLISGREAGSILLLVGGYVVLLQAVRFLYNHLRETQGKLLTTFRIGMWIEFYRKCVEVDGSYIESAQGQRKMAQARENLFSGEGSGIEIYVQLFWTVISNGLGLIVYGVIVGRASLLLLLLLLGQVLLMEAWEKPLREKTYARIKENARNRQAFFYLRRESIAIESGKDIRLYRMDKWLLRAFHEVVDRIVSLEYRTALGPLTGGILEGICRLVVNGIVYGYLIWQMVQGSVTLPAFLLYIGIVSGFGVWMRGLFQALQQIVQTKGHMDRYREFMDLGTGEEDGEEKVKNPGTPHEIRLEDVCFRYEGGEKDTIHNLNLTIPAGERLALVGLNGAGKTTLTKLLCGLYRPTSGKIYLDGQDMAQMPREEIFREYAVVFQDVFSFSFPLAENVSCVREGLEDVKRLEESLEKAGLAERVRELPKGRHTVMNKDLDPEGVTLSGGQMQKMMLARALYKDSPIVILDEPTAALDPIAESRMYESYDEMISGKTGIFISHRLSSTRFCDRILYLEGGCVAEEGSHEELMEKGGAYAELFNLQAQYYQKEEMHSGEKEEEAHA